MPQTFRGIDLNGLVDRALSIVWPDKSKGDETTLRRPVVVRLAGNRVTWVAGPSALAHPGGRGWIQPAWASDNAERIRVAEMLEAISADKGEHVAALSEHLRSLVRSADRAGVVVADDFGVEAQELLLDAAAKAVRFVPGRGRIGWQPHLLWRSVAAVFGWSQSLSQEQILRLRGKRAFVLCLLPDRLVAAHLELDFEDTSVGRLMTPVRSEAGTAYGHDAYPPREVEQEVLENLERPLIARQLMLADAGGDYVSGGKRDLLLQDETGRWIEAPALAHISQERRTRAFRDFGELLGDTDSGSADVILIETPDPTRGFNDRSWVRYAAEFLQPRPPSRNIVCIPEDAVVRGCAEFSARLAKDLPTFFDYLPRIEIAALDENERIQFVPLLPRQDRVAGNATYQASLGGFQVPAAARHLEFHLFKEGDRSGEDVRFSRTDLPVKPEAPVPISLHIEQRPVSGYAVVDVVPNVPDALGSARITLDWRRMMTTGMTRAELLKKLEREQPRGYPDAPPPLQTHWAVWRELHVERVLENFIGTPPGPGSTYESAVNELRQTLGRRSNPSYAGHDASVNEARHAFGSAGDIPASLGKAGSTLVEQLRKKIGEDLKHFERRGRNKEIDRIIRHLCLGGAWMFAKCPDGVLDRFRNILRGQVAVGHLTQAISRSVTEASDINETYAFLARWMEVKGTKIPAWQGAMNELKAVANILRFRPEAAKSLNKPEAVMFVRCALGVMSNGLQAGGGRAALQQKFLWAAMTFLLVLRYRSVLPDFIAPPKDGERGDAYYELARGVLQEASRMRPGVRRMHRLVPDTVKNALEFLNKSGGDPNIITVLTGTLDGADQEDDGDADDN